MGIANSLSGHVQPHNKVRYTVALAINLNGSTSTHQQLAKLVNFLYRMVEDELFPALHYFGIRFYAYNPVRTTNCCIYTSPAL